MPGANAKGRGRRHGPHDFRYIQACRTTNFEDNLGSAFGGATAIHAAIPQATGGNMNGQMFLLINDSVAGYQTGDLIVRLTNTDPAIFSNGAAIPSFS